LDYSPLKDPNVRYENKEANDALIDLIKGIASVKPTVP